jgi:hypothetical protein
MRLRGMLSVSMALTLTGIPTVRAQGVAERMYVTINSVDSTRQITVRVEMSGHLFESLGVSGAAGGVHLEGPAGTATTPAIAEPSRRAGAMTFTSPVNDPEIEVRVRPSSGARVPALYGRGHVVRVVREAPTGALHVETDKRPGGAR